MLIIKRGVSITSTGAAQFVPYHATLPLLRTAVQSCTGCDLYRYATQAVLGEGTEKARLFLIGEQPGAEEDLQGRPFVGPAGRILDQALEESGIARKDVYITNAVKHFKFEERGKRRLHKKPSAREVRACRPWLEAELTLVQPRIVGCLGATAAQSILGNQFRLTHDHGRPIEAGSVGTVVATVHPSSILRAPEKEQRESQFRQLVSDLEVMARLMQA